MCSAVLYIILGCQEQNPGIQATTLEAFGGLIISPPDSTMASNPLLLLVYELNRYIPDSVGVGDPSVINPRLRSNLSDSLYLPLG